MSIRISVEHLITAAILKMIVRLLIPDGLCLADGEAYLRL